MKTLLKWLFWLIAFLFLLVVALVLLRNPILKRIAEWRLQVENGLDARIGYLHAGLTEPIVRGENFKLYNPPASGGETFLDVPEIYVEYDRAATLSRNDSAREGEHRLARLGR